jgi:hypothetical protein
VHVGFLHHGGERLLGKPARLQEGREVAALPQFGDVQLYRPGPRLPQPVALAVALDKSLGALFPIAGAGLALDLQLHQALAEKPIISRSKTASELFSRSVRRFMISSVIGGSSNEVVCRNPTLPANHRWPTASRSFATALLMARSLEACFALLHHSRGPDPRFGEVRVFYDISGTTVEILAVVAKSEGKSWLA